MEYPNNIKISKLQEFQQYHEKINSDKGFSSDVLFLSKLTEDTSEIPQNAVY